MNEALNLLVPARFQHQRWAEHVAAFEDLARAFLALELGRQRCFDLSPGKPLRHYRQRIVQVDHRVDASAKKVGRLHPQIPQKSTPQIRFSRESVHRVCAKTEHSCGLQRFCRADY
jgi:hypothetical protein